METSPSLSPPNKRQRYQGYSINEEPPSKHIQTQMLSRIFNELNPEQKHCYKLFIAGHSMLITGHPGTGKTFLLESIFDACLVLAPREKVAMTGTLAND
jgi:DNA replication protein DnaC